MIQLKCLGGIQEFQSQGFLDKQIQVHIAGFVAGWKIKPKRAIFITFAYKTDPKNTKNHGSRNCKNFQDPDEGQYHFPHPDS